MAIDSRGFFTADIAAKNIATDLVIHQEICDVEARIMVESANSFLSVTVNNTLFTDSVLNAPITITSVDPVLNTLTLTGAPLTIGTPIYVSSTGTLPSPLQTSTIYYIVPTATLDVYQLALTKQNSYQTVPVTIDITDAGTGTHSLTPLKQSQLYYMSWKNYTSFPESRIYSERMKSVMNYFTGMGYNIDRREAVNTLGVPVGTFNWYISW